MKILKVFAITCTVVGALLGVGATILNDKYTEIENDKKLADLTEKTVAKYLKSK